MTSCNIVHFYCVLAHDLKVLVPDSSYLTLYAPVPTYKFLKNELREFVKSSKYFYLGDHFINSHNLSVDNVWIS